MGHQHNGGEEDYDLDMDQRTRGLGGRSGRIILLGDGTEVLTDSDETEMFDHDDEDRAHPNDETADSRSKREDTPAPPSKQNSENTHTPASTEGEDPFDSPSSTATEKSSAPTEKPVTKVKAAADSDIPSKLVNPPKPGA